MLVLWPPTVASASDSEHNTQSVGTVIVEESTLISGTSQCLVTEHSWQTVTCQAGFQKQQLIMPSRAVSLYSVPMTVLQACSWTFSLYLPRDVTI